MCDTMAAIGPDGVLFAKNSDRDPNEGQGLEWLPARLHEPGASLRCTWITIAQARETHAALISRPFWMWGAEMGANARGLVIGNEAVFTRAGYARTGLTGMDLVRLALERASSARDACALIGALIETHGQGGGCGHERRGFTYHNSFLAADPREAYVLETAGRHWTVSRVTGARSISNGLTLPGFAEAHADRLRTRVSACRVRQARTQEAAAAAEGPACLFHALRSHGGHGPAPRYGWLNGGMAAPCMHAGGLVANSQTTASWVSELRPGGCRHWVTGVPAPCLALFKPVAVEVPADWGPFPGERADGSLWWRHEALHRRVMRDPERFAPPIQAERDAIESAWLANPPTSEAAFAEHVAFIERWTRELAESGPSRDLRPWWTRRYWRKRNRRAGLHV